MRAMVLATMLALLGAILAVPVVAQPADTVGIVKEAEDPSNAEIAVRLSEETALPDTSTVVIGRDDEFADSLASGVLQATAPLLLVPRSGPIPERVRDELQRLGPDRTVLLGGEAAVGADVAAELEALGYAVERRAGASRFETAVAIAATDAASADTAILARAFPAAGSTDPTQAFADALAAGGLAAERGWPVLLTQTEVLTGSTRDYLAGSQIRSVKVMGGTAAISDAVTAELTAMGIAVERIAGASRADTAIEVAKELGADTAADAAHVVLVQGSEADGWAGGFAAAARAALLDAPIVLAASAELPPETRAWLEGAAGTTAFAQQAEAPVLTCVVVPALCEEARVALGLPPAIDLLSRTPAGGAGGGQGPSASEDGSVVGFISQGALVQGVAEGAPHVYVHRGTRVELVDVTPAGNPAVGPIGRTPEVAVSGGGGFVAFTSEDQSLDPRGTVAADISAYVRDLAGGTTRHVSVDLTGAPVPIATLPSIDADGSVVTYTGRGETRAQPACGACRWIWWHDLATGTVGFVRDAQGQPVPADTSPSRPQLSADGRFIAFQTRDSHVPVDDNGGTDVYVYEIATARLELVSVTADGTAAAVTTLNPQVETGISGDGRYVAFAHPGDLTGEGAAAGHIYLRDRTSGTTVRLSQGSTEAPGSASGRPQISDDGAWVVFAFDRELTSATQGGCGVYRHDVRGGGLQRVDPSPAGGNFNCPTRMDVAGTGAVVFDTVLGLHPDDDHTGLDVYRTPPASG